MKVVRRISKRYYVRQIMACFLTCYMLLGMPLQVAMANPNPAPGTLPSGILPGTSGGVSTNTAGFTMNVNSNPGQTVINWKNFDIGNGATVNFNQSNGWVLNQVYPGLFGGATGINGHLNALNCGVIITNPRGIVFGSSAFVDAQSFIASSLRMDTGLFKLGKFEFGQPWLGDGVTSVEPGAQITGHKFVGLIGKKVLNMGTVSAGPGGTVVMAAGDSVKIAKVGSDIVVNVQMSDPSNHPVDNGGFGGTGSGSIVAPGADVILAAGDIWSTAIGGVESLRATAHRDVSLMGDVTANGGVNVNSSTYGDAGGNINVNGNVQGSYIKMKAGDTTDYEASMDKIVVADGKTLTSTSGNIDLQAVHDITLGGDVSAARDLLINADRQGQPNVHQYGGDLWAKGTLTAGRDVKMWANGINLDGDVTATGRDLLIWGRSSYDNPDGQIWRNMDVAAGVTLKAGDDLRIRNSNPSSGVMTVTGHESMSLIAADELTTSDNVSIGVTGSDLLMQSGVDMDTANYDFFNQGNTNLTLISTAGSVFSTDTAHGGKTVNAADMWKSIGATAEDNITLEGEGSISLKNSGTVGKSLYAKNGNISVTGGPSSTKASTVTATQDIVADNGNVSVLGNHKTDLDGAVTAGGSVEIKSDTDYWKGDDVIVDGPITAGTTVDIEGEDVVLNSDVTSGGDMSIKAHGDYDTGSLHSSSYTQGGDVTANGKLSTTAGGNMDVQAARHINLTNTPVSADSSGTMNIAANTENTGVGDVDVEGDLLSAGNMDISSAENTIYLAGDVKTKHGNITFHNNVIADGAGNQKFNANAAGGKVLHAKSTITKTTGGNLTLMGGRVGNDGSDEANYEIDLDGDVTVQDGSLILGLDGKDDDTTVAAGGKLQASEDVIVKDTLNGEGKLDVIAGDNILLKKDVTSAGDMLLKADNDGDNNGDMTAMGNLTSTGGNIDIYSSDTTTYLHGNVTADDDITLHNNAWTADGIKLDAGDDVTADGTLTGAGDLDIDAGHTIKLKKNVDIAGNLDGLAGRDIITNETSGGLSTGGNLTLEAGDDIRLKRNVSAGGTIDLKTTGVESNSDIELNKITGSTTSQGDMTIDAYDDIDAFGPLTSNNGTVELFSSNTTTNLHDDVTAGEDIILHNNTWTADGIKLDAGDDVEAFGTITGAGDLTIEAGTIEPGAYADVEDIRLHKDVTVEGDLDMSAGNDIFAYGKLQTNGTTADGDMTLNAGDDIYLKNTPVSAKAADDMAITADLDPTNPGSGNVDADGDLLAGGDIDIASSENTIYLGGDVISSGGNVTLHNNVVADGSGDQAIEATTGKLEAQSSIHKTTSGDLDLFGGFNGPLGAGPYDFSVYTKDVTVDKGGLNLSGNAFVYLMGSLYSRDTMKLTSNADADKVGSDAGYLHHQLGTIQSLNGNVELRSYGSWTHLYGGSPVGNYVSAGHDLIMYGNTYVAGDRKLYAGDDVVLAANRFIRSYGASPGVLNIEAGDDIMLGVDNQSQPWNGSGGEVAFDGGMSLTAGDDIYAHGKLSSAVGGDISAMAKDDIKLYATPTSADAGGHLQLIADSDDNANGDLYVAGNLYGNMTLSGYDVTVEGNIDSHGTLNVDADDDIRLKRDIKSADDMVMDAGDDIVLNQWSGDTTSGGKMKLTAGKTNNYGDVEVWGKLETTDGANGNMTIVAPDDVTLHDDITVAGKFKALAGQVSGLGKDSTLKIEGDVIADNINMEAGNGDVDGFDRDNIEVSYGKNLTSTDGDIIVKADDHIYLGGNADSAGEMKLLANNDSDNGGIVGNVKVEGNLNAVDNIEVKGRNIYVDGDATSSDAGIRMIARDYAYDGINGDVKVGGKLDASDNITVKATDDITLGNAGGTSADAGGDITLKANRGGYSWPYGGDLTVSGSLYAGGDVTLDASDDTIYLGGDVYADGFIWLMANTKLDGYGEQWLEAGDWIRGDGYVRKCTYGDLWMLAFGTDEADRAIDMRYESEGPWDPAVSTYMGNIWMVAPDSGDIQISGDVTTFGPGCEDCEGGSLDVVASALEKQFDDGCLDCPSRETGGVLIYAADGKIYTDWASPDPEAGDYSLGINVTGNSDHWNELGIYNPFYELMPTEAKVQISDEFYRNRAAIAIVSSEDLVLGPDGSLNAFGRYYDDVDDRGMINFLDYDGSFPPGTPRNQGDPFDLAIYTASLDGDVSVDMPTQIKSRQYVRKAVVDAVDAITLATPCISKGAMVIDAFDTVTFGPQFEDSLAGDGVSSDVGDRLEVVSRRSEWLEDAIGRLPYALGGGPFVPGYNYVLRGAGADNPAIGDGAPAWVLESRGGENAPLYTEAGETQKPREFEQGGCPALMKWFAGEVGLPEDQIQVILGGADYLATDIQPCEACSRLKQQADMMAKMDPAQVDAWATAVRSGMAGPISPEMITGIRTALADNPAATSFDDAAVEYVRILSNELGFDSAEAVAMVTNNYSPDNADLGAYINARVGM